MALTRDFKKTVKARVERDPAFRDALLDEAIALGSNNIFADFGLPLAKPGQKAFSKKRPSAKFVLGRERFEKIMAVEGITLTPEMKARQDDFERRGLTPAQRRREILKAYRTPPKSKGKA